MANSKVLSILVLVATTIILMCEAQGPLPGVNANIRLFSPHTISGSSGVLQVRHNGRWGSVCDDLFDQTDADVACRQLGFIHAIRFGTAITLGFLPSPTFTPIWLDDVQCDPTDTSLQTCDHNGFGINNCLHEEDVAIFCTDSESESVDELQQECGKGIRLVPGLPGGGEEDECRSESSIESVTSGGRVEVFVNGIWGTVCDDEFGDVEANVACQQLGFMIAIDYGRANLLGFLPAERNVPIYLDDVQCLPTDTALQNCSHNGIGIHNCFHDEDVALFCSSVSRRANNHNIISRPGEDDSTTDGAGELAVMITVVTIVVILVCVVLPITTISTCCCLCYFFAYKPSTRQSEAGPRVRRIRNNCAVAPIPGPTAAPLANCVPVRLGVSDGNTHGVGATAVGTSATSAEQVNPVYEHQQGLQHMSYPMPLAQANNHCSSPNVQCTFIFPQPYANNQGPPPPPYSAC